LGHCKQKQHGLRGLLCPWPPLTEWEMHITAQGPPPPVSEMTYTVSSGTSNSTIPYHTCARVCMWYMWHCTLMHVLVMHVALYTHVVQELQVALYTHAHACVMCIFTRVNSTANQARPPSLYRDELSPDVQCTLLFYDWKVRGQGHRSQICRCESVFWISSYRINFVVFLSYVTKTNSFSGP